MPNVILAPARAPGTVFDYPACVYGFVVFAVFAVISGLALRATCRLHTTVSAAR